MLYQAWKPGVHRGEAHARYFFSIPDLAILLLISTLIYGVVAIGKEWRTEFQPVVDIDLSVWALPYYTLLSGIRGAVAYLISLGFTLVVGYVAAKLKTIEKVLIPMLDILQSIPVLGFLPGLLLGLVALFPHTNTGLELAAVLMIFTGQVWNMTFSFYSSVKSVPTDFKEASTVIGLNWRDRFSKVELPFSALNLAWNSLLSMAGGWFFLIPCEAMTLGDKEYRLPGIGAYMDVAIKRGDQQAICLAIIAMVFLIVSMDFVIWRPILSWVQKFRLEDIPGVAPAEPLMQIWIREAKLVRWFRLLYHDYEKKRRDLRSKVPNPNQIANELMENYVRVRAPRFYRFSNRLFGQINSGLRSTVFLSTLKIGIVLSLLGWVGYGAFQLLLVLLKVPFSTWIRLFQDTGLTLGRVILALIISTIWAVPAGIWIGTSSKRIQYAQPVIQVLASFPAPMLYPLAISVFYWLGIPFGWGSMLLMLLGVQWYVLFNVLAGALRIPQQLNDALLLMEASRWDRWTALYLPSIFPSLATGWITAAGGAWNASVVAEYINYKGNILKTGGLGATLSVATASEDFTLFAASLSLMVFVVILLNRFVWAKIYQLAQTRFRMDI